MVSTKICTGCGRKFSDPDSTQSPEAALTALEKMFTNHRHETALLLELEPVDGERAPGPCDDAVLLPIEEAPDDLVTRGHLTDLIPDVFFLRCLIKNRAQYETKPEWKEAITPFLEKSPKSTFAVAERLEQAITKTLTGEPDEASEPPVKRGRGRPRKGTGPVRRQPRKPVKRGRPRKVPVHEKETESETVESSFGSDEVSESASPPPAKRGRGRPRNVAPCVVKTSRTHYVVMVKGVPVGITLDIP